MIADAEWWSQRRKRSKKLITKRGPCHTMPMKSGHQGMKSNLAYLEYLKVPDYQCMEEFFAFLGERG